MTTEQIITIGAIVAGPIAAVLVGLLLESIKKQKERKKEIFRKLMKTRGLSLSPEHVEALNMIIVEFNSTSIHDRSIRRAWKLYFYHLCNEEKREQNPEKWVANNANYLSNLIYRMGKSLGYSIERDQIQHDAYVPMYHRANEENANKVKLFLTDIADGRRAFPVLNFDPQAPAEEKKEERNPA